MKPQQHRVELLNCADSIPSDSKKEPFSFGGCDGAELVAAVTCGALGGLVDILFVGAPNDGKFLEAWADRKVARQSAALPA